MIAEQMSNKPVQENLNVLPDIEVDEKEYLRLLGYPREYRLTGRSKELAEWSRDWYSRHGHPWVYRTFPVAVDVRGGTVQIDRTILTSQRVADLLREAEADEAVLVAVSAGSECETTARTLWEEQKPDEYYFLEMYGSAVVEHLITRAGFSLCDAYEKTDSTVLPHYSPGYPDWGIADQQAMWNLIAKTAPKGLQEKLTVLETGMLRPKKSLLALFGITKHKEKVRKLVSLIPCNNCSLAGCIYRRSPYTYVLPEADRVSVFQSRKVS